jgi:hypothetical protein
MCPSIDFLDTVPQFLTKVTSEGINTNGEYIIGYLDSLKVSITNSRIMIKDSSLCKYYLGDNFKTLTKGDTQRAIEKINDSLHIPFHLADITKIDFAQNFIMKHPVEVYYPYLGEAQYYHRLEQNNGLYYKNKQRLLVFYGKNYEQKQKKNPIPEFYQDKNTLRYELRLNKNIRKQLKLSEIKAKDLYNELFYKSLIKRWHSEYLSIQKIQSILNNMTPTGSTKALINNLALITVLEIGQSNVLSKIKEWQLSGSISKKQAYDHRATVKQLTKINLFENQNELISELNKKVKEASRNW